MKDLEKDTTTTRNGALLMKCILKTLRFMWQISELPIKIGTTMGTLYRYAYNSVDNLFCVAGKARRKERDGDQNSTDIKLYLEENVLERKLPEADLKALVDLPAGLDYNEWLASHTLALFDHVNLVYGTVSEFCTPSVCADMIGPANRTYLWFDDKGKKTRLAAPQYIDYVMTFTQKTVSDETIFPTKYANEFPSSFESIARKILRLQFHVIAHLYAAHFREIALLGLHTHLNLTFAHLTALHRRFNLIDEKETDVLRDLEIALRLRDDPNTTAHSNANLNETAANAAMTMDNTCRSITITASGAGSFGDSVNSACLLAKTNIPAECIIADGGVGGGINCSALPVVCKKTDLLVKMPHQWNSVSGGSSEANGSDHTATANRISSFSNITYPIIPAYYNNTNTNSNEQLITFLPSSQKAAAAAAAAAASSSSTTYINYHCCNNNNAGNNSCNGSNSNSSNNKSNNNNNRHHYSQQQQQQNNHGPNHVSPHYMHHPNFFTQNSGLIQCNTSNAPTASATTSTTTA